MCGSLHADDGHARRALPLRRHPLVLDHVRARRHHHRHGDAVARSGRRRRRSAASRPLAGHARSMPTADAAPGKILHEMRGGEMAMLGEVPFRQYYGSGRCHAAVRDAGRRLRASAPATGRSSRELWPAIESGAGLARRPGRHGRRRLHRVRARRQDRACPTRAGRTPTTPCSTPTAAWPRARSRWSRCRATPTRRGLPASMCARALGLDDRADTLGAQAEQLRRAVRGARSGARSIGFYAIALDGSKAPCRVRTSNPGHALWSGIVAPRARRRRRLDAARQRFLLRLGRPHRGQGRGALQPDVLSQRLDLAARQRPDRPRPGPRRRQAAASATSSRR